MFNVTFRRHHYCSHRFKRKLRRLAFLYFQEVQASTLVSVNFPVTNMSVNCPKVTASHEEMECLVTVVDGSSLIVTSDMGDGQGPQNYTIAGT